MAKEEEALVLGRKYDVDDVLFWVDGCNSEIDRYSEEIQKGDLDGGRIYIDLAGEYRDLGLARVAQAKYTAALDCFGAAADAWATLVGVAGERWVTEELRSLVFSSCGGAVLHAFLAGNEQTIQTTLSNYRRGRGDVSPDDDEWPLSTATLMIAGGNTAVALKVLERGKHRLNPGQMLVHSFLWAVVQHDEGALGDSLAALHKHWLKRIRGERLLRMPDAVCDDYSVGRLLFAEHAWKRRTRLVLGEVPASFIEEARARARYA